MADLTPLFLVNDEALLNEEGTLVVNGNVLSNDSGENVSLTITQVQGIFSVGSSFPVTLQGNYGTLQIAADGSYTYTLASESGAVQLLSTGLQVQDVFTYTATDTGGTSETSSAVLTITVEGSAPEPLEDAAAVSENGTLTANGNVLDNDVGVNGAIVSLIGANSVFSFTNTFPGILVGNYGTLTLGADDQPPSSGPGGMLV